MANEPWYSSGLLFTCIRCGRCCRRQGVVKLAPGELEEIEDYLGLSGNGHLPYFLTDGQGGTYLRDGPRGECVFLDWESGVCRVYPCRPEQCRSYPFWPTILGNSSAWQGEGRFCPGIDTGELHSLNNIEMVLRKRRLP